MQGRIHSRKTLPGAVLMANGQDHDSLSETAGQDLEPVLLDRLLGSHGIGRSFIDFSGALVETPLASRLHILRCMGAAPESPDALQQALREHEERTWTRILPPWSLVQAGAPGGLELCLPAPALNTVLQWELSCEQGGVFRGWFRPAALPQLDQHVLDGAVHQRLRLSLPPLPPGYHALRLQAEEGWLETLVLSAPCQTWQAPELVAGKRLWGLSAQLYTLRSASDWGIGDFADLSALCTHAAAQGAAFVLLNPLHCPDLRYPDNASPYSPDDRRFLNPLYLHLPWCGEYMQPAVQALVQSSAFRADLAAARACTQVDYAAVHRLKLQCLGLMYLAFQSSCDALGVPAEFRSFVQDGGSSLAAFAGFQAARWLGTQRLAGQSALADPDCHLWLQWLARRQLQRCQGDALAAGMAIGLVQDLAVGSIADGCEVQTNPALFCTQARIGAPPDYFNPQGQNWGLPPLLPDALSASAGRHLRDLLQASMSGCGALRIDHVMSLMRLWWCPDDGSNAGGAYVYYPVDLLFAILRLESQRHRCMVIGEDLGVVPAEIRQFLDSAQVYSNSVFYFEKYDGWHFRKPQDYKPHALAMMTNHDVPPLNCWWSEDDLVIRRRIGLVPAEKFDDEVNWRRGEKSQILTWLQEQGCMPAGWDPGQTTRPLDDDLREALARGFGRVASALVSVQLDDLAGADSPINIPGTHQEYANWRRKLPLETAAIFDSNIALRMMQALRYARGQ
ncbi:MAG: 4-alpha-glucanotransferase [Pseudohongiellaceae bacterium]